jgi:Leucine-rich repeat (LRR) protein
MNQIVEYNGKKFGVKKRRGLLTLNLSNKGIKDISEIEDLEYAVDLQVLKLNDNEITKIKGLESLTQLKILNLSHNKITKIQGLEKLTNLEDFNLEYNEIEIIQGLDTLKKLKRLSFDGNKISKVESFKNKDNLTYVILGSSNPLYHEIDRIFGLVNCNNLREFSQMSQIEKEHREKATWEEIFRLERLKDQQAKKKKSPKWITPTDKKELKNALLEPLCLIILFIIIALIMISLLSNI